MPNVNMPNLEQRTTKARKGFGETVPSVGRLEGHFILL